MLKQLSILAAAAGLASATNPGYARVTNNCPFEVSLWSVGSQVSGPRILAAGGAGKYAEQYTRDPLTGGRTLKITRERDGLNQGKPQINFAYTLDPDRVWYDLNNVLGEPLAGHKLTVVPSNGQCGSLVWNDGRHPAGSQVRDCYRDSDVTLTLCAA